MNKHTFEMLRRLERAGITYDDALALRRIAMTLHRWFELECGDSNDYASWCITRGRKVNGVFSYGNDDGSEGKPFIERHIHSENTARYEPIADRETGARKRLAKIMARYPDFAAYVQTDPRGAALYILQGEQLKDERPLDQIYNRGIAVYK